MEHTSDVKEQSLWVCQPENGRQPIHCTLSLHTGTDPEHKGVVILCHGLMNDGRSWVCRELATRLPWDTCRLDFHGCGRSAGQTSYGNYMDEVRDVLAVLAALAQQHPTLPVLAICGHSKAASVVYALLATELATHGNSAASSSLLSRWPGLRYIGISGRCRMDQEPASRFSAEQRSLLTDRGGFLWRIYRRSVPRVVDTVPGGRDRWCSDKASWAPSEWQSLLPSLPARPGASLTPADRVGILNEDTADATAHSEDATEWVQVDQPYHITDREIARRSAMDMTSMAKQIGNMAVQEVRLPLVLVVHGTRDQVIPMEDAYAYASAMGDRCRLGIVDGADHFFRSPTEIQTLVAVICDFLQSSSGRTG